MQPDNELLRQYASARSEEAFAELVRRHVNLVYSAALRQAGGDAHLAHDVAQSVFTDLARKARSLSGRESLAGWLYTSAYFAAGKMVRTETRRREREEQFMREPAHDTTPDAEWEKLRPALDAVMHELKETDREAILLRYFENRAFAEVGAKLGIGENGARMRVDRAVEKLRVLLAKRGIATAAALTSVISANAVQMAPAHLAATLASFSTASATAGAGTFSFLKLMTTTKLKFVLGALIFGSAAAALVIQHQSQTRLKHENDKTQPTQNTTSKEAAMQKMDQAKQGVLALVMFASDNQQQFPKALAQASRYAKEGNLEQIESNFEVLNPGSITNIPSPSTTILLREKQPWQTPNGNWLKTYGFADGHSEIHSEPTSNFDKFEKGRIIPPLSNQ